jgi:inorganic triphosphatase YgiF
LNNGANYLALLLRFNFVESETRINFFKDYPPSRTYVLSKRLNVLEENFDEHVFKGMVSYAWFVWDNRHTNLRFHTDLIWIDSKKSYNNWKNERLQGRNFWDVYKINTMEQRTTENKNSGLQFSDTTD